MGVQISSILQPSVLSLDALAGRVVGIDAFNILYQFLSIIRQRDGTPLMDSQGNITSHLTGLFYRTSNLLEQGIKLVFIFDGKPPKLKRLTISERKEIRAEAKKKWEVAKAEGRLEDARKYAQASGELTDEMVDDAIKLLEAMGLPVIHAPSEAEAQAAYMVKKGDLYACVSQDYDALVFGVPRLIRNLTVTGRRKLPGRDQYVQVSPEMICLKDVLDQNKITYDQLVLLCLLVGNDFEPGIKGIGPKKALNLVKKYPTLDKLYASKEVGQDLKDIGLDLYQVEEIFKKPDIDKEYDISFKSLMPEKIVNLLCDKHDFSRDRVEKAIDKILKAKNKSSQTRLTAY